MKTACPKGHRYPESLRPGRSDCAVCHRESERERYHRDPEKSIAAASAWQREHREYRTAYMREYWWKNLEERRTYHRERARRLGPKRRRREWSYLYGDPCSYCGCPAAELDHIIPLAAGGPTEWENLAAVCPDCNKAKRDYPLLTFLLRRSA